MRQFMTRNKQHCWSINYLPTLQITIRLSNLWKKVKTKATHNRYFEEFVKLIQSVEDAMTVLATQADEIKRLMGVYTKHMAEPPDFLKCVKIIFLITIA